MALLNRTFVTPSPVLDLQDGVGQRVCTFRFDLVNGATGVKQDELHPMFGAVLSHDTSLTTKRRLTMTLGVADTARVNTLTDRVDPFMVVDGQDFPLGRYVFTSDPRQQWTAGDIASVGLVDEMFIVDQPLLNSVNGTGVSGDQVAVQVMQDFPQIAYEFASSEFNLSQNWVAGTGGGQVLQAASLAGDFFSPWFGNDRVLHMVRSFDPAAAVPTIDFDQGNRVFRDSVLHTSEILSAPNRFIAVSNSSVGSTSPTVGIADIPSSAPHSFANRGFYVVQVADVQADTPLHVQAIADNLARRQTVFEYVSVSTPPDPRHDSYDVISWQGERWLEVAWTLNMREGGAMSHMMRKVYT